MSWPRKVLATSSPDQLLALFGKYERMVIVSHDRDFKKYRAMLPEHERSRFTTGAGRLFLDVAYPTSPQRVAEELESIAFHYRQGQKRHMPLLMTILDVNILDIISARQYAPRNHPAAAILRLEIVSVDLDRR